MTDESHRPNDPVRGPEPDSDRVPGTGDAQEPEPRGSPDASASAVDDTEVSGGDPVPDGLALTPDASDAAAQPGSPLPRFWEAARRLPRYAMVAAALIRDPAVPKRSKAALGAGGLYLASPIDLVPGVIPVVGQLDDIYVLLRALRQALHSSPPEVAAGHLHRYDLTMASVEGDIRLMEETTVWLVRRGLQTGNRAATRTWQRLRGFIPRRPGS